MTYGREGRSAIERGTQRTLTLDDTAAASHPGNLRVSLLRWSMRYPMWPVIIAGSLILTLILISSVHILFVIALPLALIPNYLYWYRIREHFMHGDANPGIIVSDKPVRIAVLTDMSKGEGSYLMLSVIEEQPLAAWGQPAEIGKRVATVGLYGEGRQERLPYWETFIPRPVDPVAAQPEEAQRLLESFDASQWAALEQAIREVEPAGEGLYPVGVNV